LPPGDRLKHKLALSLTGEALFLAKRGKTVILVNYRVIDKYYKNITCRCWYADYNENDEEAMVSWNIGRGISRFDLMEHSNRKKEIWAYTKQSRNGLYWTAS
jgi:hypothetical protein